MQDLYEKEGGADELDKDRENRTIRKINKKYESKNMSVLSIDYKLKRWKVQVDFSK